MNIMQPSPFLWHRGIAAVFLSAITLLATAYLLTHIDGNARSLHAFESLLVSSFESGDTAELHSELKRLFPIVARMRTNDLVKVQSLHPEWEFIDYSSSDERLYGFCKYGRWYASQEHGIVTSVVFIFGSKGLVAGCPIHLSGDCRLYFELISYTPAGWK